MLYSPHDTNIKKLVYDTLEAVPEDIYQILESDETLRAINAAMAVSGLGESVRSVINIAVIQIFSGSLPPKILSDTLKNWLRIDVKTSFTLSQHLIENLVSRYQDILTKQFGSGYFSPAGEGQTRKPRETTPQLDGNIVNLRGQ